MSQPITIKAHEWENSASPWVQFTIYVGTFPSREAVAYAHDEDIAEIIAKALGRVNKAEIVRIKGPPDRENT